LEDQERPFQTIRQLARLLRAGEISPTELTRLSLERLNSIGRTLNAVVRLTPDRAEREAMVAEAELRAGIDRGPLHGIPYGAKDILATAGIPTTWGAAPFQQQVFPYDAAVVRRLHDAGAILVAKLATVELAGGMTYGHPNASFTGPAINPWNREAWAGGSSSGPAVAVAAGLVPFAIGSDTGGSITIPAAYCGVSGFRPTFGRVSRYGTMTISWTLDRLGPLCRTADDCGSVLQTIAGADPRDPSTVNRPYEYQQHPRRDHGFRFAIIGGATDGIQPAVRENFEGSLRILGDVGTIEEVRLPIYPYDEVFDTILAAESYSAFQEFVEEGHILQLTSQQGRVHRLAAMVLPAHQYLRAQRIRRQISVAVGAITSSYDALVSPTIGVVASGLDQDFQFMVPGAFPEPTNLMGNLTGTPTITVPNGFGEGGLPTALQFTGSAFGDNRVLDAARAFQERTAWHSQHPST